MLVNLTHAAKMLLLWTSFQKATGFPTLESLGLRQVDDGSASGELIGDLLTGITTPVGQSIANILQGTESGQSGVTATKPTGQVCTNDPCCKWFDVSKALTTLFLGANGRCNELARGAIRLGFHDAGTWSKKLKSQGQDFGGADGSLLMNFGEASRAENNGLQLIIAAMKVVQARYKVGYADLVQYAAKHAVVTCPLGPRVRAFVGRDDATRAAPDGLLPSMLSPASDLINLFADKTITPHMLAALVGAHSTSRQFTQNLTRFGASQDSTPGVWDVLFYNETLQAKPRAKLFRFPSDIALANDPRISDEWAKFVVSQSHWNEDYSAAYIRLSLLGVNKINQLTECTKTLPTARPTFQGKSELDATE